MSTNGCAKLSCSLGNANFDQQTIPETGAVWLKERLAVSVLTTTLERRN